MASWKRITVRDNEGKPMSIWRWEDYIVSQNIAVYEDGDLVRWDFEVCIMEGPDIEKYIAESKSLDGAQRKAREHFAERKKQLTPAPSMC
jgi:hypothetical protein